MDFQKKIWNSPYLSMIFGFLILILMGTLFLMLPISSADGCVTSFTTAFFTATSAACVNGLVLVDTGTYYSAFGHNIILILIQIGGVGIVALAVIGIRLRNGKIGIRERMYMEEVYNTKTEKRLGDTIKWIFLIIVVIEFLGAVLLSFEFVPSFGLIKGIFYSLFYSISAFNNAGFDLLGQGNSIMFYSGNWYVLSILAFLVVMGGLGFITILDVISHRKCGKNLYLTTKIVCVTTGVLIVLGAIFFIVFEWNSESFLHMTVGEKILNGLFLSITTRTAGFSSIDMRLLNTGSVLFMIVLMYIGASPASTGGGLKTTTVVIPILCIVSILKGKDDIEVWGRRISKKLVLKSLVIISLMFLISFLSLLILSFTENMELKELIIEVTSAINTVGVSFGGTSNLSLIGKYIIIVLMFIGRIGPITLLLSLSVKSKGNSSIKLIKEDVLIG